MTLLEAIDTAIGSPIDTKRLRALRGIMADFLGEDPDADLLVTLTPGWAQCFADYLSTYPNRLKKSNSPYLSTANQRLYLTSLRSVLRKAAASGAYPDVDPIQPLLDKDGETTKTRRKPTINLHDELKRLCTLNLDEEESALRKFYFLGLAAGGLELSDLSELTINPSAPHPTLLFANTPLSNTDFLLSLLKAQIPTPKEPTTAQGAEPIPVAQGDEPTQQPPSEAKVSGALALSRKRSNSSDHQAASTPPSPARLRRFFAERRITLYQAGSIFSDLLTLAAGAVGSAEVAKAAETRLHHPSSYFKNIKYYQSLFSRTCSDSGMLAQRWYAFRSINPKQSGADIERAIHDAPEEISSLVSDTYAPSDLIVVERDGVRSTRNHPAVRSLVFIKTLRPSVPRILKHVGDVAAYKRTSYASDGYYPVPYSEIYRMKLVLGAVGADENTEIYTNEELRNHFTLDELAVGDYVTVAKPGYEQFTARIIRRKAHDHYCVEFPDFGFSVVMNDIPRALIQVQSKKTKEQAPQ